MRRNQRKCPNYYRMQPHWCSLSLSLSLFPSQTYRGEEAFYSMQYYYGWAQRPILSRLHQLNHNIPITVIAGSNSWMNFTTFKDVRTAEQIAAARPTGSYVGVHYVDEAGHHVHAQQPYRFNKIVNSVFELVDVGGDMIMKSRSPSFQPPTTKQSSE